MQPFFHGPQNVLIVARPRQNQALGRKAMKGEAWRVEIGALQAPQHRPLGRKPGQNAGQESGRHRALLAFCSSASQLMKRTQRQAAPRQMSIDGSDAKRQNRHCLSAIFAYRQLPPQGCEPCAFSAFRHVDSLNVLYLFLSELRSQVPSLVAPTALCA